MKSWYKCVRENQKVWSNSDFNSHPTIQETWWFCWVNRNGTSHHFTSLEVQRFVTSICPEHDRWFLKSCHKWRNIQDISYCWVDHKFMIHSHRYWNHHEKGVRDLMIYNQHCWNNSSILSCHLWLHRKKGHCEWCWSEFHWCHDANASVTISVHIRSDRLFSWCECLYSSLSNFLVVYEIIWNQGIFQNLNIQKNDKSKRHHLRNLIFWGFGMMTIWFASVFQVRCFILSCNRYCWNSWSWWREQRYFQNIHMNHWGNFRRWIWKSFCCECPASLSLHSSQWQDIQERCK